MNSTVVYYLVITFAVLFWEVRTIVKKRMEAAKEVSFFHIISHGCDCVKRERKLNKKG
jgi:hypothetical protein